MCVNPGLTGKGTVLIKLSNIKYNNIQRDGGRTYDSSSRYT